MLKDFDKITKEISTLILSKGDEAKIKELVKKQDSIGKSLSDDEAEELLSRNIASQYKGKIRKLRGM